MSYVVTIRFYAELNDLVKAERRFCDSEVRFEDKRSIKDLVESLGVPRTEVDLLLVNGESMGFEYHVQDGDRISVYPVFETFSVETLERLRDKPLRRVRFICDVHLGKLAKRLRLLGFDTAYARDAEDLDLVRQSIEEKRILLTRNRGLLKRNAVERGYLIYQTDPFEQTDEILTKLDLREECLPFTRCLNCNGMLIPTDAPRNVPPRVQEWCHEFYECASCKKTYWKGTHYEQLNKTAKRHINPAQ